MFTAVWYASTFKSSSCRCWSWRDYKLLLLQKELGAALLTLVDIRPAAMEQATSLGAKVFDLGVPAELAIGEGGYAKYLPKEWLVKEREKLNEILPEMDIVFLKCFGTRKSSTYTY